eukprot:SAG11_NODE_42_length_20827_cov_9.289801_11_plen_653_part_00
MECDTPCSGLSIANVLLGQSSTIRTCADSGCAIATSSCGADGELPLLCGGEQQVYQEPCVDISVGIPAGLQCRVVTASTDEEGEPVVDIACPPGYYGSSCQMCDAAVNCSGLASGEPAAMLRGSCVSDAAGEGAECQCFGGYTGLFCETDTDECHLCPDDTPECDDEDKSHPCQNGAVCTDSNDGEPSVVKPDTFHCDCVAGWTGERCDVDFDECASHPCGNGGTCSDSNSLKNQGKAACVMGALTPATPDPTNGVCVPPDAVVAAALSDNGTNGTNGTSPAASNETVPEAEAEADPRKRMVVNDFELAMTVDHAVFDDNLLDVSDGYASFAAEFVAALVGVIGYASLNATDGSVSVVALHLTDPRGGVLVDFAIEQNSSEMVALEARVEELRRYSGSSMIAVGGLAGNTTALAYGISNVTVELDSGSPKERYCANLDSSGQCVACIEETPEAPCKPPGDGECCPGEYFDEMQGTCAECRATDLDATIPLDAYSCSCVKGWSLPCEEHFFGREETWSSSGEERLEKCKAYYFGTDSTEKHTLCPLGLAVEQCDVQARNCMVQKNECRGGKDDLWRGKYGDVVPKCKYDGECTVELGDYSCECVNGYTGKDCTKCEDKLEILCADRWLILACVGGVIALLVVYSLRRLKSQSS